MTTMQRIRSRWKSVDVAEPVDLGVLQPQLGVGRLR